MIKHEMNLDFQQGPPVDASTMSNASVMSGLANHPRLTVDRGARQQIADRLSKSSGVMSSDNEGRVTIVDDVRSGSDKRRPSSATSIEQMLEVGPPPFIDI
mmetsp:Transcript_58416/g.134842  ORF Transcript_58416/g.134842 Transcript_58416/m.134842 type:complete len:101 (-) Transcript_58416:146-448(-)